MSDDDVLFTGVMSTMAVVVVVVSSFMVLGGMLRCACGALCPAEPRSALGLF